MGSTSKNPSVSCSDSLNGLKFGQKIYFEDVGIGAPAKSGGGSSAPSPSSAKKGGNPPRCQVEGCRVDLSDAKAYYGRHKVCGVHSKTPKVVVNGLDQRFCQQCSRFHQLPEFDQGKRSCRRRLAGHNERRRKPPPGTLFSSPYGRTSSPVFETGKSGGFLMDFSTYPKLTGRDTWPTIRPPNHSIPTEKPLPNTWQNDPFRQGLPSGTHCPVVGPTVPSAECFAAGASNSGCALSLLSNQTWDPQHGSSGPFASAEGAQMVQSTMAQMVQSTQGIHNNQFSGVSWMGFKGHEDDMGSYEMPHHLGPSRVGQPADDHQYCGDIESSQDRQYIDLKHSRACDSSTQFMNWSL